jgi:Na+/melibiose symporter-like transporter
VAAVLPLVQGRDEGWPAWSLVSLAASLPLGAIFWTWQRRLAARGGQPLVAPSLLMHRPFLLGLGVTLLFFCGNASLYFVLALYLQQGLGLPPLESGLVFTTLAVGFFATSMAAPWFARRLGRHAISSGALMLAAGHAGLWLLLPASVAVMLPILLVQGCGLGMVMAPLAATVLAGLPAQHAGVASGVMATVQQIGNAVGVALIGLLYYGALSTHARNAGSHAAFRASLVALFLLALAVAAMYRRFSQATISKE